MEKGTTDHELPWEETGYDEAGAHDAAPRYRARDGDERAFDVPTQLVDPDAYAATLARAASDEDACVPDEQQAARFARRGSRREWFAIGDPVPPSSDDEAAGSAAHVALPQRLGRFTLVELLGMGGMAEVFLARPDAPSDRGAYVVVKRIHPHLSIDERFVRMFLREARVAAGLHHPNIVRIHELGSDLGVHFLVMEYIEGLTLQRLAQRAWRAGLSLPMELVLSAAADAARALHYAHSVVDDGGTARRIVHRDVSPDNLIVDRAGTTKLLDFGVAKAADTITVTRAGEVKGKVPYMAPEQLHGRSLDGRSDLYSLGATLYWLLTGKRPFRGETDLELMQSIAYEAPVPPRQLNPRIPAVVERVILRLLEKSPERRHENGQQVADELTALLPPSRREVAAFVEQALALAHVDDVESFSAESFIASAPRTAHLVSEARRAWLACLEDVRRDDGPAGAREAEEAGAEPTDSPVRGERDEEPLLLDSEEIVELDEPVESDEDAGEARSLASPVDDAPPPTPLVHEEAPPRERSPARVPWRAMAVGAGAAIALALLGWSLSTTEDELRGLATAGALPPLRAAAPREQAAHVEPTQERAEVERDALEVGSSRDGSAASANVPDAQSPPPDDGPPPEVVPAGVYKLRIEHEGSSRAEKVVVEPGEATRVRVNRRESTR